MSTILPDKKRGQDHLVNVRVNKQENEKISLFIDDTHILTLRFKDSDSLAKNYNNIVSINNGRKRQGLYLSKSFCPSEILFILAGDEVQDMQTLKHALDSFQRIYPTNNSNYSFGIGSYKVMLKRFFTDPVVIPNMGKGPDISHYFMKLPDDYISDE